MIFYFSGTGNSLYAAKSIAQEQNEKLISIAQEMQKKPQERIYTFKKEELVGFVYPIYAWGPPQMVMDFVKTMHVEGEGTYVFSLNTCGSEEGHATQMLQKALMKKGLSLASAFSISMPSNYVAGADVEPKDIQQRKLERAELKLAQINTILKNRKISEFDLLEGKKAGLKTAIINPLFNKFARQTKQFYVTDACIQCGLCQKICPVQSITLDPKPVWGNACTQCLGCINRCPVQAIQYGKATESRGRYQHPGLLPSD